MTTRRSFFRRVGALVAAVALAPEIAFRCKLEFDAGWKTVPYWIQTERVEHRTSGAYEAWVNKAVNQINWREIPFWNETYPSVSRLREQHG